MSASCEIHRAEWAIPYPAGCIAERVPCLLRPFTHVEHEMDAFPWQLAGQLATHLENPVASFEYLHLTTFFRARAAMLAMKGRILDHGDLHIAMSKHQVQVGGIYRKQLLRSIRTAMKKHNLGQLPECISHPLDPNHDPELLERNRTLIHRVVQAAEIEYENTLTYISLATEMDEEVSLHSVGFWIKGAGMPQPIPVRVRVKLHDTGHDIMPSRDEAKQLIRDGRTVHKIRMKVQKEFDFAKTACGTGETKSGGQELRVIGDFNILILPCGKEINLATKHKARAVLRFIHATLKKAGETDFYAEEMRDRFNSQFSRDMAHKQWTSDRFREDLFKGKDREFDLLFETLDKTTGRYRLRI